MVTPDVSDLPHEMDGGVKVFKLAAEPVKKKIVPFKTIDAWGYNGSCPGPTIQVQQGERVRVISKTACRNRLPCTGMGWNFPRAGWRAVYQPEASGAGRKYVYELRCIRRGRFSITRTARCRK